MRRILIAFGALGGGTALAFTLAGIAFLASPEGRLVPVTQDQVIAIRGGGVMVDGGWGKAIPPDAVAEPPAKPIPMPAIVDGAEPAIDLPLAVPPDATEEDVKVP